jgi:SAM-dependent methyltransferase
MALVDEWLAGVPGLHERLTAGAAIADVACGSGGAAVLMGRAFPNSRVVGYDAAAAIADVGELPGNVELREGDARALADQGEYDLVTCLDSFHHFGDPQAAAARVRGLLRPGGVVLVAESALVGDFIADQANPLGLITYGSALLYCLQENLAAGGPGVAGGDGTDWLVDALKAAGFVDVTVRESDTGFRIHTGSV